MRLRTIVGLTGCECPVLPADAAASFRGLIAVFAERIAIVVVVLVSGKRSSACALALGPWVAVRAERGAVVESAARIAHPPAAGAFLHDQGVFDVTAAADRAVLSVGHDEPVLLAPTAGLFAETRLVQQTREPDQRHGAVRRWSRPRVRVLRKVCLQLPCGSRRPRLCPLKNGPDCVGVIRRPAAF